MKLGRIRTSRIHIHARKNVSRFAPKLSRTATLLCVTYFNKFSLATVEVSDPALLFQIDAYFSGENVKKCNFFQTIFPLIRWNKKKPGLKMSIFIPFMSPDLWLKVYSSSWNSFPGPFRETTLLMKISFFAHFRGVN